MTSGVTPQPASLGSVGRPLSETPPVPPVKAGQLLWRMSNRERRWLLPKLDELYRVRVTYPAVNTDVSAGNKVVRDLNQVRDMHAQLTSGKTDVDHASAIMTIEKEHVVKQKRSMLLNIAFAAASIGGAIVLFPLGGFIGEMGLAVFGAGVFEGAQRALEAFKWQKNFEKIAATKTVLLSADNTKRLEALEQEIEQRIESISDDQSRRSVQMTTLMRENDHNPDEHPSMIRLEHGGHYRDLVKDIATQMSMRYPDDIKRVFGPPPQGTSPESQSHRMQYYELISLTFLADAIDHEFRHYGLQPEEAEVTSWTTDDVRAHLGNRVEELISVQRETMTVDAASLQTTAERSTTGEDLSDNDEMGRVLELDPLTSQMPLAAPASFPSVAAPQSIAS